MDAAQEELFEKIKAILIEEFDIDADSITPESKLVDDFDLDSIDAAELIVKFKSYLPSKVDASMFRGIVTIQDLIDILLSAK